MSAKPVEQNSTEALAALFSALQTADGPQSSRATPSTSAVSREALERLAERIEQLVGKDFTLPAEQPLNEEGLPIMEITEPEHDATESETVYSWSEPAQVTPLSSLSPEEREKRRRERDALLERLEEEERFELEEQEEADSNDHWMKRVKEEAMREQTGRKRLSQSPHLPSTTTTASGAQAESSTRPKKKVTFSSQVDEKKDTSQRPSATKARVRDEESIMKMNVVEKYPPPRPVQIKSMGEPDSDDEGGVMSEDDEDSREAANVTDQRELIHRYHQLAHELGLDAKKVERDERVNLAGTLKSGAVVDGQLVGDSDDSDGAGEGAKKVIGMLTSGVVAEGSSPIAKKSIPGPSVPPVLSDVRERGVAGNNRQLPTRSTKISRFKADLHQ